MSLNLLPNRVKPDLRSPKSALFRRGTTIGSIRVMILVLLDSISMSIAWKLAISWGTRLDSPWAIINRPSFLPLILVIGVGIITARGLYKAGKHRDYFGLIKAISLVNLFLLLIAFLYNPDQSVSRSTFLLFWLLSMAFVCTGRVILNHIVNRLRARGAIRHPAFLIVSQEHQEWSIQLINRQNCYNILGIADATCLDRNNRDATFETLHDLGIAEAFVSWDAIKNRLYLCWRFQTIGITLRILPTELNFFYPRSELVPSPVTRASIIIGGDYWIKRYFDFCFAILLLLLFSPVYILIAVLIKLDSPGSVFFRQTRVGLHGKQFKVWKFRTMVADADKLQTILEARNEMKDGILFKMKEDPRITRIGKILRRYSLDELPQLFNILMGEMSFVGPRPLPVRDVERFREWHYIRQEVLPGITGLWQVSGRSNIDNFDEAANLDLAYICNWSLQLDLKIMLQTIQVVFRRTGAY